MYTDRLFDDGNFEVDAMEEPKKLVSVKSSAKADVEYLIAIARSQIKASREQLKTARKSITSVERTLTDKDAAFKDNVRLTADARRSLKNIEDAQFAVDKALASVNAIL